MNYGSIRYIIGCILKVEALLMLLPMAAAVIYQERSGFAFVVCALLCLGIGTLLSLKKAEKNDILCQGGLYICGPWLDCNEYYGLSSFCFQR